MPLGRAQRLLAFLDQQAETDLIAAFRDLPLVAAVRRHIDAQPSAAVTATPTAAA